MTSPSIGLRCGMLLASAGVLAGLRVTGAIDRGALLVLAVIPLVLLFWLFHGLRNRAAAGPDANRAGLRYTNGIMASSMAYVAGLGVAMMVWREYDPTSGVTFLLALLPIAPILAMIWVMARYLREERDEYLRHRAIMASLGGLATVLAVGTFWGFLETFELVPHVPGWWAVPVWALGMGMTQAWWTLKDRSGSDDDGLGTPGAGA